MDTKHTRSEFAANVALVMSQASARQGASWKDPAPARAIVKRSFLGYTKALFSSLLNLKG